MSAGCLRGANEADLSNVHMGTGYVWLIQAQVQLPLWEGKNDWSGTVQMLTCVVRRRPSPPRLSRQPLVIAESHMPTLAFNSNLNLDISPTTAIPPQISKIRLPSAPSTTGISNWTASSCPVTFPSSRAHSGTIANTALLPPQSPNKAQNSSAHHPHHPHDCPTPNILKHRPSPST